MEVNGQLHTLAALTLRKDPQSTYWTGGWVGSNASLEVVEKRKNLLLSGIESWLSNPYPIAVSSELSRPSNIL
jgi:hypothetical protein